MLAFSTIEVYWHGLIWLLLILYDEYEFVLLTAENVYYK